MKKIGKGILITLGVVLALILLFIFRLIREFRDFEEKRVNEQQQMLLEGRELLTQALKDNYGLKDDDYQIISKEPYWGSAYGYDAIVYKLEVGDKDVNAEVDIRYREVFTDYYGKEFEEALTSYLDRKMESNAKYTEMGLKSLSVTYYCLSGGDETMENGIIPASVKPDGFEEYLKSCDKDGSLCVDMNVAWYSEESKVVPEDLKDIVSPDNGKLPAYLTVNHFNCGNDAVLKPTNLVDMCMCSFSQEKLGFNDKVYRRSYEYLQVAEDLIVGRYFDSYYPKDDVNDNDFHAELDNKGHLHITPANDYYNIYVRDTRDDANIRFIYKRESEDKVEFEPVYMKKCTLYEDWYEGKERAVGYDIRFFK